MHCLHITNSETHANGQLDIDNFLCSVHAKDIPVSPQVFRSFSYFHKSSAWVFSRP